MYTDGSAFLAPASAGWGDFIQTPPSPSVGPCCMDTDWIGAHRPKNNTGEISAFYYALQSVRDVDGPSSLVVRRRINLISDSEYCVLLFGDNSIKPRRSKPLIQRVRHLLNAVRSHHDIAIS